MSSQIVDCRWARPVVSFLYVKRLREALLTLVFVICSLRGERISATSDVEKSISSMAMSPSHVSKHLVKGSVV